MSSSALTLQRRGPVLKPQWLVVVLLVVAVVGLFGPLTAPAATGTVVTGFEGGGLLLVVAVLGALACAVVGGAMGLVGATGLSLAAAFLVILAQRPLPGQGGWGYWLTLACSLAVAAVATGTISLMDGERTRRGNDESDGYGTLPFLQRVLPAATVPFLLLLAWEGLVVGFRVPAGIFPTVSSIGSALVRSWPVLMADAYLTFVREVLFGFAVGLASGFLAGTAIAFSGFLRRGFLPLATAFGAVPIVGLAPVLGRALGVDWESKAAVVVIVTFFPVVLNTVQGLTSVDPLKLELLRSYAARPRQIFWSLRLPNALPYLFNALKVAIVLSVVSVIVAEFLIPGPPSGLGQRISLSAHRGQFDIVFAAILVSSVISMLMYWGVLLLERWLTAWHPSSRAS
ncbi:MAG TPA: ABC transporter permease [Trueperaceae bacterium]|nr:ABC transporter permease [Trueperaceae bacterium]